MQTAPVLAVLVCHDGATWLPRVLAALRDSSVRPQRVVAVDTGSRDKTPALLTAAAGEGGVIDAVVTLPRGSGYAEAVARGVDHADTVFVEDPDWLWLLHDDSAPEEDCLAALLNTAEAAPSAGALGPLAVDWGDPQLIVDAGLSLDASGHLRGGMGLDNSEHVEQSTEVLAMPSAGMLVRRTVYDNLDGLDEAFQVFAEDVDFGWRVNVAGRTVLCVPRARIRHVRALTDGERPAAALADAAPAIDSVAAARRLGGLRTFLVNCSPLSYRIGVPRLVMLCLLRGIGFFLIKDMSRSRVEFAAVRYLLGGSADLRAGRERRAQERAVAAAGGSRKTSVRGLFVGRLTRLRYAWHQLVLVLVRRRMASEVAFGRLPDTAQTRPTTWVPADELRAATFAGGRTRDVVAVPLDELPSPVGAGEEAKERAPALPRPSPGVSAAHGGLVFIEVDRRRILAATLFAPPLVLGLVMIALALAVNWHRLGLDLTGGRLLPVADLGDVWSAYLASWHSTGGGTTAQVPAALAVIGALGAPLAAVGGSSAAVALLFFADIPVAALSAYAATRRMRVQRWVRALLAAAYALLPAATAAVAQGRVDVVVAHMVLPLVCAGVTGVLAPRKSGERWMPTAVQTALGLTVLGAFSPLGHVLVLAGLVLGFVFVHSSSPLGRRIAGVVVVVLLPIGLLAPWLITLAGAGRALLLHGIGARLPEVAVGSGELALLHPGGVGALPVGGLLLIAALVALVVRPTWRAATGCGIVLIGGAGVAAVLMLPVAPVGGGAPRHGWAGVPLLVVGIGLIAILLAVVQRDRVSRPAGSAGLGGRIVVGLGIGGLVLLVASAVIAGREGPLRSADTVRLAAPIAAELARTGESVLVIGVDGDPPRMRAGRMPSFGDDDLPLPPGSVDRLYRWQDVFLTAPGPPNAVRDTVAAATAAGVRFLVLPHGYVPDGILEAGGELVTTAPPLADGRQVVRLRPVGGQVVLIAPELSQRAIDGKAPIGDIEGEGIAVVDARLPDVRLRVSDGPGGRLLVLAATFEPGWRAAVNGEPRGIVPAWGHQVAVEVPTRAAEVVVDVPQPVRTMLLLVQIGGLLFTALTAIPARRPRPAASR